MLVWCEFCYSIECLVKWYGMQMSDFSVRLREERARLGLTQEDFGGLGGVKKLAQWTYEKGDRSPDAAYLGQLWFEGVDVQYVLTGLRADARVLDSFRRAAEVTKQADVTDDERQQLWRSLVEGVVRHAGDQLETTDEQRLLALYRLADPLLRRGVLAALAQGEMPSGAHPHAAVDRGIGQQVNGDQSVRGTQVINVGVPAAAKRVRRKGNE